MKKSLIVAGSVALLALGTAGPAAADDHAKAYGKTFAGACGKTWGEVVSAGQPRTEESTHYRSGYKGGVQGLLNNGEALVAHLPLCG